MNLIASPSIQLAFPSHNCIKECLIELAESSQYITIESFPEHDKILIALDCWTSPDKKSFIAIIGYFITEDFHYYEILLGFVPLSGAHTGEQLAKVILDVLKQYNLLYRVLGITTDNVSYSNYG